MATRPKHPELDLSKRGRRGSAAASLWARAHRPAPPPLLPYREFVAGGRAMRIWRLLEDGSVHAVALAPVGPPDPSVRYPSLVLLLGSREEDLDPPSLDARAAYISYLHRAPGDGGASGTELLDLAVRIAWALGASYVRVHDSATAPPCDSVDLSTLLLLTRGTTFYGRAGFEPTLDSSSGHDAALLSMQYGSSDRAFREHLKGVAVPAVLSARAADLASYVSRLRSAAARPRQWDLFYRFDAAGQTLVLPVDRAHHATEGRRSLLSRLAPLLDRCEGDETVAELVGRSRDGAAGCALVRQVVELLEPARSPYWAMRSGVGLPFNYARRRSGGGDDGGSSDEVWWDALPHFATVLGVRGMALQLAPLKPPSKS